MTGTEIVVQEEKQSFSELVRAGVGEEYQNAYIAAMRAQLPAQFQNDPVSVIALGLRAKRSGLDPFTQIHAWKNERGELQFQIDYKGFIDIASRDPRVESLEFQHVYDGETFKWSKAGDGAIVIEHHGGLKKGPLLGAYCVAHMAGDMADHMEMRLLEDYKHLFNKQNWRNHPSEMILARVLSATVRVVCPESTQGLYSEADWDGERWDHGAVVSTAAQAATLAAQEELAARLSPPAWEEREEEVAIVDPTAASAPSPEEASSPTPESDTDTSPAESFEELRFHCGYCTNDYDNQRSLAGHGRAHGEEKKAEAMLPEGWVIMRDEDRFVGYDADGVIQHEAPTWMEVFNIIGPLDQSAVKPENSLEVPEHYLVFVDRGGQHVAKAPGEIEIGRYPTHDDAALACINHRDAQPDPTLAPEVGTQDGGSSTPTFEVPRLAEIYRRVADSGHPTSEVARVLNSIDYEDTFAKYRQEGASQVQPLDLDEDGRRELVDLLELRGIIK